MDTSSGTGFTFEMIPKPSGIEPTDLGNLSDGSNTMQLKNLTPETVSDIIQGANNKDNISDKELNFKITSTSENSSASSIKQLGNLFSGLSAECAHVCLNKDNTSYLESSSGLMPIASSQKMNTATKSVNYRGFSSRDTLSDANCNTDSSSTYKKSSGNVGGLTFGHATTFTKPDEISKNSGGFTSGFEEFQGLPFANLEFNFDPYFVYSNEPVSGTDLKFYPTHGIDSVTQTKTVTTNVTTRHQCINMMKEYFGKSLEELRLEDYKDNRKGVNSEGSTSQTGELPVKNLMTTSTDATLQTGEPSVTNLVTTPADATLQTGGYFTKCVTTSTNTTAPLNNFRFDIIQTTGVNKLLQGLEELLLSGKYSDVTLNVQGKEFNVHRNILSIWSPVFSALMEHETRESSTAVVNIDDCNPDTFSDLLHFFYTGSTKKLNAKNVFDLYSIADKYQVPDLNKVCVNYMKNNITLQNFCDILTLSLQHNEEKLNDVATYFFLKNSAEITETDNWGLFLEKNPVAGNELVLKAQKLSPNRYEQSSFYPQSIKEEKCSIC